jgi:hypothetical protein
MRIHRAAVVSFLIAAACSSSAGSTPQIGLIVPPDNPAASYIEVAGLSGASLDAIRRSSPSAEGWTRVLRVTVKSGGFPLEKPAVAGRYTVVQRAIRFTPMFPFDPGREYEVSFNPSAVQGASGARDVPVTAVVSRPSAPPAKATIVSHLYPSGEVVPENQLRMYIHFSAPMGRRGGLDYIQLLDENGTVVEDPFLPLDAEFWNEDHTRYTVFFDPGRQKRGILPNRAMGPSLTAGRTYTLVIKKDWTDGNGQPLADAFRRRFRVGPAALEPLDQRSWKLDPPLAGTLSPLVVRFPRPLDHGLLLRALGVKHGNTEVQGERRVEAGETRWSFAPRQPWQPGDYELVVLSVLEDLSGNRIGRAFEVDNFERTDRSPEPEKILIPFHVPHGRRGTD